MTAPKHRPKKGQYMSCMETYKLPNLLQYSNKSEGRGSSRLMHTGNGQPIRTWTDCLATGSRDGIINIAPSVLQPVTLSPLLANGAQFQTIPTSRWKIGQCGRAQFLNVGTFRNFTDNLVKCIGRCRHMTTMGVSFNRPALSPQWFRERESLNHERWNSRKLVT